MNLLDFREPANALTHFVGFLLAFPAGWLLLRNSTGPLKRIAFLLYSGSLAACYLGSTLYHGLRLPPERIALFHTLDYVGIYLLIAGTVTPVSLVLLTGRWRVAVFTTAWLCAAIGIALQIFFPWLPSLIAVVLYLIMGWGIILSYFELSKVVTQRQINLALYGGILYSVGAAIHVANWPDPWPGVFGFHAIFHIFVLAGSTCHFLFMLLVVAPFVRPSPIRRISIPSAKEHSARAVERQFS